MRKFGKKYDITSINSIYSWIGKYINPGKTLSLQEQTEKDMANKSKDDQIRELKAKLKQAEKKAEYEALRARAFDTMINLAEEKFQHPHQKKSGTVLNYNSVHTTLHENLLLLLPSKANESVIEISVI